MFEATKLDAYTLQARVAPMLIASLPLGLAVVANFPEKSLGWGLLVGVTSSCGVAALFAQLGRDAGKKKEPELFRSWDGRPSICKLRHRDSNLDSQTFKRCHERLGAFLGSPLPTADEETADPETADAAYQSCIHNLRERARENKLVLQENINYGFRRNLWAVRGLGTVLSILGVAGGGVPIYRGWPNVPPVAATATLMSILLLLLWTLVITPYWVRVAAEAYADRLIASAETLK